MRSSPWLVQVGLDHRQASLDELASLHGMVSGERPLLVPSGAGALGLVTCHRLELYLEGVSPGLAGAIYGRWIGASDATEAWLRERLIVRPGIEAGRHLLRVTAGLESAVLGEDQILRQVRHAYREACRRRSAGPLLHRLLHAAFRCGKRVRSETALAEGGRSLAGAAVLILGERLGGLEGKSVLVLGVGEMGSLAADRLRRRGVARLVVCNRTWAKAKALAGKLGAEALPWEWRAASLAGVDGVVCATGAAQPVVEADWLEAATTRRGRPLVVVDLAVPRNVARPAPMPAALSLTDVEGLSRRLDEQARRRRAAVREAGELVEAVLGEWRTWVEARPLVEAGSGGRCGKISVS